MIAKLMALLSRKETSTEPVFTCCLICWGGGEPLAKYEFVLPYDAVNGVVESYLNALEQKIPLDIRVLTSRSSTPDRLLVSVSTLQCSVLLINNG